MKQYKIGDTILVKGKVLGVDADGSYGYLVDFDEPFGVTNNHYWALNDYIVDEPAKPELPKGLADELEDAKKNNYHFADYINKAIYNDYTETNAFVYLTDVNADEMIKVLSDAWYNGYTVEQVPTWYIKVPGKFGRPTYYAINDGSLAFGYLDEDKKWYRDYSAHAFTNEEIKKYDLENFHKEPVADD